MFSTEAVADAIIPLIRAADKPVTVALMGSNLVAEAFRRFTAARIPTYDFPERAASALSCLSRRADFLQEILTESAPPPAMDHAAISAVLRDVEPASWLDPDRADSLLALAGIPSAPMRLARDVDEAVLLAHQLGFPLVLKIASPDILHKSDVGGVFLNLATVMEVGNAFEAAVFKSLQAIPNARIEGCNLQRYVPPGQEVIIGATRDAQFGPLLMFGAGGVDVEGLKDVSFHLAPLTEGEADVLIDRTWAGHKLAGFRSIPPADRRAVRDALLRLSALVHAHPEISEIEINPLRVLERGAVAVDVRVKLAPLTSL
jgi:acetyltransferase